MKACEVCRILEETGVVPVVRALSAEDAITASQAVLAGGVRVVEITMTVPDAERVIAELSATLGDRVLVGAGTVLDADAARACLAAGAEFIVSPGLHLGTVELCRSLDKAVLPGALTPTEVITAWQAGADMVKVFPCSALGGAKYLRALRGPLRDVKLLPTGGVNLSTAEAYIAAGAVALGVGSELVDSIALREGNTELITERARQFLQIVRDTRAMLGKS